MARHTTAILTLLLLLVACTGAPSTPATPSTPAAGESWPLVYSQDFEAPTDLDGIALTDPSRWIWSDKDGRGSLELLGASDYKPPFRSPTSIALVPELLVADFDLEVDLLQTGRNYGHRDMCLFLGFVSPEHFNYVHLATSPDANAHNIFRVHEAARTNLAEIAVQGIDWGEGQWHRVRMERRTAAGTIKIFWDGSDEPILEAREEGFEWGRVGFGSFDDSGRVTRIRIWAPAQRAVELANPFR